MQFPGRDPRGEEKICAGGGSGAIVQHYYSTGNTTVWGSLQPLSGL